MAVIRGHVVDPHGRPVSEAAVYIVSSPTSRIDTAQLTDEQGRFAISARAPGLYTVGVRSDEWGVVQSEVEVKGEEPVAVEMRLTAREE